MERIVGIDLTPKMVQLARSRCAADGISNASFEVGDVESLPFESGSFSPVCCRYALHHMRAPAVVVAEMARVCAPGGWVVIADIEASSDPGIRARFDESDRLRDPSHARTLTGSEILTMTASAGLRAVIAARYELPVELGELLGRSAPPDPAALWGVFERAVEGSASEHGLGLGERRDGDKIRFEFPILVARGVQAPLVGQ